MVDNTRARGDPPPARPQDTKMHRVTVSVYVEDKAHAVKATKALGACRDTIQEWADAKANPLRRSSFYWARLRRDFEILLKGGAL